MTTDPATTPHAGAAPGAGSVPMPERPEPAKPLPSPFPWRLLPWMLLPAALGIALIPFARTNFYYVYEFLHAFPKDDIWEVMNFFGDGTGVTLMVILLWWMRRDLRRTIGLLLIALLLCGTIVEVVKYTTWRVRPKYGVRMYHDKERIEFADAYIAKNPGTPYTTSGDDQWLWIGTGPRPTSDDFRSFPSGHTAAAIAVAVYLSHVLPRGAVYWWVLGVMCGLARVEMRRHYIEDMLVGVSVGWVSAHVVLASGRALRLSVAVAGRLERAGGRYLTWRNGVLRRLGRPVPGGAEAP